MPILKIQVNEYECINCGYKWINRVNVKDGPVPKRCAKCKGSNWKRDEITPTENGLRRRIKGFKKLYNYAVDFWSDYSIANCWSGELTEEFLSLDPRPTIKDLERVVCPPGLVIKSLGSQYRHAHAGYVPDPDKPGWLKYDEEKYIKILKQEAQKRQQVMQQIIETRYLGSSVKD
jgi:predicted nucleic-acid-binding Zn-ribbon protein